MSPLLSTSSCLGRTPFGRSAFCSCGSGRRAFGRYLGDAIITRAILDRLVMNAVRLRIDGLLYPIMSPGIEVHPALVSRL